MTMSCPYGHPARAIRCPNQTSRQQAAVQKYVSILIPCLDGKVFFSHFANGVNEGTRQAGVCYQGNVVIHGSPANPITVIQFAPGMILWDIHHQVYFFLLQIFHHIGLLFLVWPMEFRHFHSMFPQETRRAGSRKNLT